jgi:hypothetical protein
MESDTAFIEAAFEYALEVYHDNPSQRHDQIG